MEIEQTNKPILVKVGDLALKFFDLYDDNLQQLVIKEDLEYCKAIFHDITKFDGKLFKRIEIETINRCNGSCTFCAVNVKEPQRPLAKMNDELLHKIIKDLKEIGYTGEVSLFSNNEPLIDQFIVERCEYAAKELPNARHILFTNGKLLTKEKYARLCDCLDQLVINNYDWQIPNKLQDILKDDRDNVLLKMRRTNEIISTRGGNAPNRKNRMNWTLKSSCINPWSQMIVRPTGELSLCCNDALGQETLGDLKRQTILEAWNSAEYKKIREELKRGRSNIKLCKHCDTLPAPSRESIKEVMSIN